MELEAFALLVAGPVHEEPVLGVNTEDGDDHHAGDREGGQTGQQSEEQAERSEELRDDGQECERGRDSRLGEESHGPLEAVASEPSQRLLRAVREHDHGERQP